MLAHPTLDRLNAMGLTGMAKAFDELAANAEAERLSHAEWLALLLDREWSWRYDRKLAARRGTYFLAESRAGFHPGSIAEGPTGSVGRDQPPGTVGTEGTSGRSTGSGSGCGIPPKSGKSIEKPGEPPPSVCAVACESSQFPLSGSPPKEGLTGR